MKRFNFTSGFMAGFCAVSSDSSARAGAGIGAGNQVPVGSGFFEASAEHVFGRSVRRGGEFEGQHFHFSRGNTTGPAYAAAAAQLLEFGPDGHFIREIGHNLYAWSFAHTVRIDKEDNIWVTDKGSDMIIKFNPEGRVVMVFGRKQEASDEGTEALRHPKPPLPPVDGMFRQVTDVAWDAAGDTFISDGYINSRVAKVDKNGKWLMSFGEPGEGEGQFHTPHSIATDAEGNVYVADRGNARIQVFDNNGKFLKIIKIEVPFDPDTSLPSEPSRNCHCRRVRERWRLDHRGPFALRRDQTRCFLRRMRIRAACTS